MPLGRQTRQTFPPLSLQKTTWLKEAHVARFGPCWPGGFQSYIHCRLKQVVDFRLPIISPPISAHGVQQE